MLDTLKKTVFLTEVKLCRKIKIPPRSIPFPVVWITNMCNLRCKICNQWKTDPKLFSQELSTDEWCTFVDSAKRLRAAAIVITGGEPFLRTDLFEILGYIQKRGLAYHICTNGTLLDEERVGKLKSLKPTSISVSLDSYSAEIHNMMRGVDCFNRVIEGVKLLKRSIPKTKVGINCVISKKNFYNMYKMIPFAEELKVDQIKIDLIHTNLKHRSLNAIDFDDFIFKTDDIEELNNEVDKYINAAVNTRLLTNSFTFLKGIKDLYNRRYNFPCYAGYASCAVDALGKVSPCDNFEGNDNLRNKPLDDIWKSDSFGELRRKVHHCLSGCWDSTHAEINIRYCPKYFLKELHNISKEFKYYF